MTNLEAVEPTPDTVVAYITETWPETNVVQAMNAWFFSLDPDKHWPNYATLVTTDEHDKASNLSRPGAFRLNMGVDRPTFERVAADAGADPDYTAVDRVMPHPVYAAQRWICIVNPSGQTFREVVVPLLALAHDRLAGQRERHGLDGDGDGARRPTDAAPGGDGNDRLPARLTDEVPMPRSSPRNLLPIVAAYLPVPIIGAALSAIWDVGATPEGDAGDMFLRGTALTPPLFLPVVLLAGAALARQPGAGGRVGAGIVTAVAVAFLAGSTANLPTDLAAAQSAGTPAALTVSLAAIHSTLSIALLYNAVPRLRGRMEAQAHASPA